ncbi:MAG: class II aldolase/adducin family protein [Hyphomonadaceae bacterium]|nr:class II aldolase/adducin family protein [Hyphomonadaceae bacterium]
MVDVLWVKGSGGDIGSMKLDGFSTLYLDKFRSTEKLYRGVKFEDEMVGYLPHCTFNLNPRAAPSTHPPWTLLSRMSTTCTRMRSSLLAASSAGEAATKEIWGGAIGWLPGNVRDLNWRTAAHLALRTIRPRGVMLAGHGIICWGDTSRSCYENTIGLIADAAMYLNNQLVLRPAFGGQHTPALPVESRQALAATLMPQLRAQLVGERSKIGHYSDDAEALEFVCSRDFERLANIGTSCLDHFLRTKKSRR